MRHSRDILDDERVQCFLHQSPDQGLATNGLLQQFAPREDVALLPGAFNPLHPGHRRMSEIAAEILGTDVWFELSMENVDKAPLLPSEAIQRLRQFEHRDRIRLTNAATFAQKAKLVPDTCFVVGADTIARIADLRYYGGDIENRDRTIEVIMDHQCSFLVFGRLVGERFKSLHQLDLPRHLIEICQSVDEAVFRDDISSSELRQCE